MTNPNAAPLIDRVPSSAEEAKAMTYTEFDPDMAMNFSDPAQLAQYNEARARQGYAPVPAPSGRQQDLSGIKRPSDFIPQKPVEDHTDDSERAMTRAELREILARQRAATAGQTAVKSTER